MFVEHLETEPLRGDIVMKHCSLVLNHVQDAVRGAYCMTSRATSYPAGPVTLQQSLYDSPAEQLLSTPACLQVYYLENCLWGTGSSILACGSNLVDSS